jgi:uncharacterized membrane protein
VPERVDTVFLPAPQRAKRRLRRYFIAGLVAALPVAITLWLAQWVFRFVDGILGPTLNEWMGDWGIPTFTGIGVIALLIGILALGFFASNFLGRRVMDLGEWIIQKIPFVKSVYSSAKQLMESTVSTQNRPPQSTVLIEYPRTGAYAIGFVTKTITATGPQDQQANLVHVFVPTAPNPTSGMLVIVSAMDVIEVDWSVEEAMKIILSGGYVSPSEINLTRQWLLGVDQIDAMHKAEAQKHVAPGAKAEIPTFGGDQPA